MEQVNQQKAAATEVTTEVATKEVKTPIKAVVKKPVKTKRDDIENAPKKAPKKKKTRKPRVKVSKDVVPSFAKKYEGKFGELPTEIQNPWAVYSDGRRDPPVPVTAAQSLVYKIIMENQGTKIAQTGTNWFAKTDHDVYGKLID